MRKADLINQIAEKTGIPKVDVLVTLEAIKRMLPSRYLSITYPPSNLPKNLCRRLKNSKQLKKGSQTPTKKCNFATLIC
jgi:hypothetical protein